jgi:thymidine kinase
MFSGKTTELIRRLRCAEIARQRVAVIKPATDTRSGYELLSHNGIRFAARMVDPAVDDLEREPDLDVLGVDEAQFLGAAWLGAIEHAADAGVEVVAACLNQDYLGRPFGIADRLLAMADHVVHLKAVCTACGRKDGATKTLRVGGGGEQVEIGGSERYRALCRRCWVERAATAGPRDRLRVRLPPHHRPPAPADRRCGSSRTLRRTGLRSEA